MLHSNVTVFLGPPAPSAEPEGPDPDLSVSRPEVYKLRNVEAPSGRCMVSLSPDYFQIAAPALMHCGMRSVIGDMSDKPFPWRSAMPVFTLFAFR